MYNTEKKIVIFPRLIVGDLLGYLLSYVLWRIRIHGAGWEIYI